MEGSLTKTRDKIIKKKFQILVVELQSKEGLAKLEPNQRQLKKKIWRVK